MTRDIDRRRDLGIERRIAISVAADHLPDLHPLGVARQRGGDRPALERRFDLRSRNGMEMVVYPDRVEIAPVRQFGDRRHRLELFDRIVDFDQIHFPALRDECAKLRHVSYPLNAVAVHLPTSSVPNLNRGFGSTTPHTLRCAGKGIDPYPYSIFAFQLA